MRKLILIFVLFFALVTPVCAQDNHYSEYENIGVEELDDNLNQSVKDFLNENDIDVLNSDWVNNLTDKNALLHIWQFITGGAKNPLKSGVLVAGIIFLSAALSAFSGDSRFETAIYAAVLAVSAVIVGDIWHSISAAVDAVKGCSTFMVGFIPVFAGIVALSGRVVTAPAMSALLLGATEVMSYISSFVVLPLISGYLALSISSGVSPLLNSSALAENVKKLSQWVLSLLGTLFIGILSIQTAVNSAADSVTLRTAKFILGTSVPIAGGVLSEAASTVSASLGLLKSSVGIYGVVALCLILLPIVIELILWRCVLMLDIALGELFALPKITSVLRAIDSTLSVLLGVLLTVGSMFIISLSVVVMATK
ncbi:MAG: hypothetical protein Q4B40_05835 [Clostridia bacterium]|nr:hypothetical protein [Clostridia bacterium]